MKNIPILCLALLFASVAQGVEEDRALNNQILSNKVLTNVVSELSERFEYFEDTLKQQQLEITRLAQENELLHERTKQLNQKFAFSVYAETFADYESGDKIEFTGVLTNIGNYYDVTQSHFNCPQSGTYFFSINMQSMSDGYLVRAEMVKNDVMIANAEIYDTATYAHMSTNSAIVQCAQGERVWVRAGARSEVHGEEEPYTTFMGYLIEMNI